MQKYPNDPIIRGNYFTLKKNFSRLLKKAKREEREQLSQKIAQLENKNPTEFWKLINTIKSKRDLNEHIEPEVFLEHFKALHALKPNKNFDEAFADDLQEKIRNNTIKLELEVLDKNITKEEILKATKTLKKQESLWFRLYI